VVLRLINTRALTEENFERPEDKGKMVVLTQQGMKTFIHHFEQRVQTVVQHPGTGHRLTYRRCFELQARHLAKVILGQEPHYKPFLVK